MKKIVFNSENGYAYDFVNGEVVELGKFCGIKRLHETGIYSIGNDIYQLVEGKYCLVAKDADFYLINNTPNPKTEQFTLIKDLLLFTSVSTTNIIEIANVEAYRQIFYFSRNEKPVFAIKTHSNNSYKVFVETLCGKIVESCEKVIGSKFDSSFFWNGAIWTLQTYGFTKTPIDLQIVNKSYIIAYADEKSKPVFLITSEGNISSLGNYKTVIRNSSATILVVHENKGFRLWNLTDEFVESIVFVNGDESFEISNDSGTITLYQKVDVGSADGGLIDETVFYKLDDKQHYHRM